MNLFDIILISIISGFAMFGIWFGLIHTLGSFIGTIFGAYFASRMYGLVAVWLVHITGWPENLFRVVVFIILFIIINRLVGLIFWFIDTPAHFLTKIPFLRLMNRFLGMLLGAFEGIVTIGLIIYFIKKNPLSNQIMKWIDTSSVAIWAQHSSAFLIPLLPGALRLLHSVVHTATSGHIYPSLY